MSGKMLPIYRLPIPTAARIGEVRVVTDRNNRHYVNGSPVVTATQTGDFHVLALANGEAHYVKTQDYLALPRYRPPRRR